MSYTSHGHAIPGLIQLGKPKQVISCGGPGVCVDCSLESCSALIQTDIKPYPLPDTIGQNELHFLRLKINMLPQSRERSLALTKLDEAEMWLERTEGWRYRSVRVDTANVEWKESDGPSHS